MKICILSGSYPPLHCGVGDYTAALAQGLAAKGEEVVVLTSSAQRQAADSLFRVAPEISSWGFQGLGQLARALKKIQPAIVHLQYPSLGYGRGMAPTLLFPLLRALGRTSKSVLTLHEYETYTVRGKWRLAPALWTSQRIVCTNARDQAELVRFHPGCQDRVSLIPLGSSMGEYSQAQEQAPAVLPDNQRTWLLHFGTLMPNKGWETLLPAFKLLLEEGRQVGLWVAGEIQPDHYAYHQKIYSQIQSLGLETAIHFTGYFPRSQAATMLTACPIAVQPYSDGLSLRRSSFIALLAFGRAIVTTDSLYLLEAVKRGQAFLGVLPHDPRSLAEGIKHLLDHPEKVAQLQAGALKAAEYFRWERIVNLHRSLYQQVRTQ